MAGILFIVNVPKKEYEINLKENLPNLIFEKENGTAVKVIDEINQIKEKYVGDQNFASSDPNPENMKYLSTDCLAERDSHKWNSESTLSDGPDDCRGYVKTSWEEIKQVIKPRRNKLKISRPVRGVDILGAFRFDTPLATILSEIISRLDIKNAAWNSTKGDQFWQVIFSLESGNLSEELLQVLRTFGIGSRHQSSVSLLPCALYYQSNGRISTNELNNVDQECEPNSAWSRFSSSVGARTNLVQVLQEVKARSALTFDWLFMLLVAAFVAGIGLIENSTCILVASMLISPLMGPITAGTMGTAVRDRSLQLMGVKNEFLGLFLCIVMGFIVGLTICALDEQYGVVENWPTEEMLSRCAHRSLWIGLLVAIPSGAACALAVLGDYTSSLVGVAISASILPPAVNAGLLWSMALTRTVMKYEGQRWLVAEPSELALLGTASLCLTLVNIVCVFLAGVTVYKVKEVSPLDRRDISWWRARAQRSQVNARQHQNNNHSLNWDAYTKWSSDSLETKGKEDTIDREVTNRRPSLLQQLRAQNIEAFCHNIPLENNYAPLNTRARQSIATQIEELNKAKDTQHTKNDKIDGTERNPQHNISMGYYNIAYQVDDMKEKTSSPTITPSSCFTADSKKYGMMHNSFQV